MKKKTNGTDPKNSKDRVAPKLRELDGRALEQVSGGGSRHDPVMQ